MEPARSGDVNRELAPRLASFSYVGLHRYFLTMCARERAVVFVNAEDVGGVTLQLLSIATTRHFAVIAYCFMPDHLHLVVEGTSEAANLREFVRVFKQCSDFAWRRLQHERLWQRGYFDRVLRADEDTVDVVRYVLNNPVRAGLAWAPEEYPFLGSGKMSVADLLESIRMNCGGSGRT